MTKFFSPKFNPIEIPTIDDSNWMEHYVGDSGYVARNYSIQPFGSIGCAKTFPPDLLIPWDDMPALLEERTKKKLLIKDICTNAFREGRIKWLNQNPSNFCWVYALAHAAMVKILLQNDKPRILSPQSVGAPLKKYQNIGGWGSQALDYMLEHGMADIDHWPAYPPVDMIRQGKKYFDSSRENAAKTKVTEWWEVRTLQEKLSCLFRYHPVPSGYGWMGHEMNSIDPYLNERGEWGTVDMDSYANSAGMFNARVIMGNRAVGDDMVSPCFITPFEV